MPTVIVYVSDVFKVNCDWFPELVDGVVAYVVSNPPAPAPPAPPPPPPPATTK